MSVQTKEEKNQYQREWAKKNRDKRRRYEYAWRKNNPNKVKEMDAKAGAKWSKNNPAKRNSITAKRRASLLQRTPIWANSHEIEKFYIEAIRLTKETGIKHEVDHIYPLQGELCSGLHVETNLQVIPKSENRSKKNSYFGGL